MKKSFKMRSPHNTTFKMMGSSPMKDEKTFVPNVPVENPDIKEQREDWNLDPSVKKWKATKHLYHTPASDTARVEKANPGIDIKLQEVKKKD